jgi:2-dehydro-3-deoxyphosphogluconate aldolase/(4S)-4-hydroxy-2-oxoglutarate aldolase
MTPSEIEQAMELGCKLLKFFPAGAIGGLKTLTTMAAPYKHCDLRYIPLGGVNATTTAEYLKSPLVAACGGSWIATSELIAGADWGAIRDNAKQAMEIMRSSRGTGV